MIGKNCAEECDYHEYSYDDFGFDGLFTKQFLSEKEEQFLLEKIEKENFVESQSGRRKVDYGPKVNFKKKKMKIGNFKGLPSYFKPFVERFKSYEWLNNFEPVELNILEYD